MALLHFTSGTTGRPKGAIHVHAAVLMHYLTGKLVLDFHPDDIFWCTADPGWVTGTSYGIIAPLVCGITSIIDEEEFDAERWYRLLIACWRLRDGEDPDPAMASRRQYETSQQKFKQYKYETIAYAT
jgi:acyl-CoA synthetase (AMP-forming)/AMP-acid ligase II